MAKTPQEHTLLVTGANGRLGRLLRAPLLAHDGLTPLFAARSGPADLRLGDVGPAGPLPACGTVVALWGQTAGTDATPSRNAELAEASRALARASGAARVLHFSTAAIYGPGQAMGESRPPSPANAYGRSKLAMEQRIAEFRDDGITHCCLRLANVVGADSLAPALTGPTGAPVPLDRFADGHGPLRSYICPGDLARVIAALSALPPDALPPVLNIAAPDPVEMAALARAAGREILWRDAPDTAVQRVTLDTARLTGLLPGLAFQASAGQMVADWQAARGAT